MKGDIVAHSPVSQKQCAHEQQCSNELAIGHDADKTELQRFEPLEGVPQRNHQKSHEKHVIILSAQKMYLRKQYKNWHIENNEIVFFKQRRENKNKGDKPRKLKKKKMVELSLQLQILQDMLHLGLVSHISQLIKKLII